MASVVAIAKRRPSAGHVRAGYERLINLAEQFSTLADEARMAAGFLIIAEADIKRAKEALDNGDEAAARRALDDAEANVKKSKEREGRVDRLGTGMASMLNTLRRWMARTGF